VTTAATLDRLQRPQIKLDKPVTMRVLLIPAEGCSACNTPPQDNNGDGFVDGTDYGAFAACFNGTGNPYNGDCACFDVNDDGSIDITDYGTFAGCYNGTGNPPNC